jgi:dTDP-4-dehydrorhamnose 3,5-epimerase
MARASFFGSEINVVKSDPFIDERGSFQKLAAFNQSDFERPFNEVSISNNISKYTLRGLHFMGSEGMESKAIACFKGKIFDVVVDIRKMSKTFGFWDSYILDSRNHETIYIPNGFAHGYLTLEESSTVLYAIDVPFQQNLYSGILWNSAWLNIEWPENPAVISLKDMNLRDAL